MKDLRTETVGNVTVALDFWSCNCKTNFVHPSTEEECLLCGALECDMPNSLKEDVMRQYSSIYVPDTAADGKMKPQQAGGPRQVQAFSSFADLACPNINPRYVILEDAVDKLCDELY